MLSRIHVSAIVLVVAVVWAVSLVLQGLSVSPEFFRPFSTASGLLVLVLAAFDNWLWRVPILQGWFVKRPHLWGTWRATFQTSWRDPETGDVSGPITGFMVVRQTYSDITMRLLTRESSSWFIADELTISPDGTFEVYAVYQNQPRAEVRHRSPIHYGALKLVVQGTPAARLEGVYWTDRLTRGDLVLEERRSESYDSYESAATEYGA